MLPKNGKIIHRIYINSGPPKSPKGRRQRGGRPAPPPFIRYKASDCNFNAKHVGQHLRPVQLPSRQHCFFVSFSLARSTSDKSVVLITHSLTRETRRIPGPVSVAWLAGSPNVHRHLAIVTSIFHAERPQRVQETEHRSLCEFADKCPVLRTTALDPQGSTAAAAHEQRHR